MSRTAVPEAADGEVRAWLFRIARNLRSITTGNVLDSRIRSHRRGNIRAPSQDVDFAVNEALTALADLDRDVFLMREVAGLGYEEIGRACGLTPDAVRSRIHRARLHLRAQLWRPSQQGERFQCGSLAANPET